MYSIVTVSGKLLIDQWAAKLKKTVEIKKQNKKQVQLGEAVLHKLLTLKAYSLSVEMTSLKRIFEVKV